MSDTKTNALVWLVVGLVISAVLIGIAAASSIARTGDDFGMMGGWGGVGMAFMAVPVIILILIVIIAIGESGERPNYYTYPAYVPPQPSPLDILDQRYARGEIGRDEYFRMRAEFAGR